MSSSGASCLLSDLPKFDELLPSMPSSYSSSPSVEMPKSQPSPVNKSQPFPKMRLDGSSLALLGRYTSSSQLELNMKMNTPHRKVLTKLEFSWSRHGF
ncbi:hypothetical protein RJT34_16694 [Clitoria ternatea]|uniref:Uncharacterized protein n=1 Tax=Clitoria ternatea TaxID=43366 RepID=A0AAN9J8T0_CLITE